MVEEYIYNKEQEGVDGPEAIQEHKDGEQNPEDITQKLEKNAGEFLENIDQLEHIELPDTLQMQTVVNEAVDKMQEDPLLAELLARREENAAEAKEEWLDEKAAMKRVQKMRYIGNTSNPRI